VVRGKPGARPAANGLQPSSSSPSRPRDIESAATALKRGMSTSDVHDLLGAPTRRRSSKQGDLESVVEAWETTDSVTEVTFVGGVVVKFTSSSK
jgi:hypothetical protein